MSRTNSPAPWIILGSALIGAVSLSLLSASPTPAQVGAAPTPTFVTAGNSAPATPTRSTSSSGTTGSTAQQPTPTINYSNLSNIPGLSSGSMSDISTLLNSMNSMEQQLTSQPLSNPQTGAAAPAQLSSSLGGATPTVAAGVATPTVEPTHTGGPAVLPSVSVTALTPGAIITSPTATPEATEMPTPTPQATAAVMPTEPMLTIDTPDPSNIANGRSTLVGGWVFDPRGDEGAGVLAVDVFLDGQPGTGTFVGAADFGEVRGDVAGYFQHPQWARSGFNMDWVPRGLTPGNHTLVVVAQLAAGGTVSAELPFTAH